MALDIFLTSSSIEVLMDSGGGIYIPINVNKAKENIRVARIIGRSLTICRIQ